MACMGNWVCFDCRITKRRPTWGRVTYTRPESIGIRGNVKCQQCSKLMYFLGPTIKIPPKSKPKEWTKLYDALIEFRQDFAKKHEIGKVKLRHELEKAISELKRRGCNKEREKLIKEYEERMRRHT